jgi:GTPase SAR1 family protein
MGNTISRDEHIHEIDELREEQRKQQEEMERRHKDEINALKIQMLQNQISEYKKQMKEAEDSYVEMQKDQARRMESIYRNKDMMEETYLKRIKEVKTEAEKKAIEEEQKKQKEKFEKQQHLLEKFKEQKKLIIEDELNKLIEKFNQDSNTFCLKEIKQFDITEIEKLVSSFETSENLEEVNEEQIKQLTNAYMKEKGSSVIQHINILLVGPSGVGKSTLINSVLHLEGDLCAKEGGSEPCTMGAPKYYGSTQITYRIADSRGIEKSKDYGIDEVTKDVKEFIEKQLLTKEPDNYVHCIWYCITGSRFEEVEKETLETLSSVYDDNKLPIIVVYTKAAFPFLYEEIQKKVNQLDRNFEFIPVIAKDMEMKKGLIAKKDGVDELLNVSVNKAKQAVQSSCFTGIKNIIKDQVRKNNELQNKQMEKYIKQENEKKINKFKEQMEINEMVSNISDLIISVIKYYLYNGVKSLNSDSVKSIESFLLKFFNQCIKEYKDIFSLLVEENSTKIAKKVYEVQKEINLQNESIMGFTESEDEIKKEIKLKIIEALKSKAELYCLKNAAFFISEPIRNLFSNLLMTIFERCLKKDNITKLFESSAKEMFNKLQLANKNEGQKTLS